MKKLILSSAIIFLITFSVPGQDDLNDKKWYTAELTSDSSRNANYNYTSFDVHGIYKRRVTKETLEDAKLLSDFIPGYPINWVYNYQSVEIWASGKGKPLKAIGTNDVLTTDQKNVLAKADLATEIVVIVKYKDKNAATDDVVEKDVFVRMTVTPEIEAEYIGGYPKLIKYLKDHISPRINDNNSRPIQEGAVIFTIDEEGFVVNARLTKSSGDRTADKFLIDVINKMPKWKPAELKDGIKVKQDFEFSMNSGGC